MQRNNLDFDDDFARTIDSQENIPEFKPKKKWGEAEEEKDSAWEESKSDTSKAPGAGWGTAEKSDETKEGWEMIRPRKAKRRNRLAADGILRTRLPKRKRFGILIRKGRNRTSEPANQHSPNSR